jgi:hypothetical protein
MNTLKATFKHLSSYSGKILSHLTPQLQLLRKFPEYISVKCSATKICHLDKLLLYKKNDSYGVHEEINTENTGG